MDWIESVNVPTVSLLEEEMGTTGNSDSNPGGSSHARVAEEQPSDDAEQIDEHTRDTTMGSEDQIGPLAATLSRLQLSYWKNLVSLPDEDGPHSQMFYRNSKRWPPTLYLLI
jgi:hypothetical protein